MAKPKADPLIAALIAKLPQPGTEWAEDKQEGWLRLMAMAFGQVYGGDVMTRLGGKPAEPPAATAPPPAPKPAPPSPKPTPTYPFLIDKQGFARKKNEQGPRVRPDEVTDILYDLRGMDGDITAIIWADDSMGLNGRDLTIVAA